MQMPILPIRMTLILVTILERIRKWCISSTGAPVIRMNHIHKVLSFALRVVPTVPNVRVYTFKVDSRLVVIDLFSTEKSTIFYLVKLIAVYYYIYIIYIIATVIFS